MFLVFSVNLKLNLWAMNFENFDIDKMRFLKFEKLNEGGGGVLVNTKFVFHCKINSDERRLKNQTTRDVSNAVCVGTNPSICHTVSRTLTSYAKSYESSFCDWSKLEDVRRSGKWGVSRSLS